jgi:mannan endo-1,4-beta-mannosidase
MNYRLRLRWVVTIGAAIIVAVAVTVATGLGGKSTAGKSVDPAAPQSHTPRAYLGVYAPGAPGSYDGVTAFAAATGVRPSVVVYYSGWFEPFQNRFAAAVVRHNAIPLVQIDPSSVSVAAIASGQYDTYLRSYASAVKTFGTQVILSFGHEMNGNWYSWGYRHTSPAVFVAAWRHIVNVFRQQGTGNVTWLWTINVIQISQDIPSPTPWWPGSSYVTWVGIDGYYDNPSWKFASLFGPTIKAVRALSRIPVPILVSETGVAPAAGKPAKIENLFAGVRAYGLLGLVWFNANKIIDWRVDSPAAIAAFARGAKTLKESAP